MSNLPRKKGGQPISKGFANNPRRQKKFLKTLSETFNFKASADAVGVTTQAIYKHMERCPEFKELVEAARDEACAEAEGEAYRRGIKGYEEAIIYKGEVTGTTKKYSDRLLELVLRGNMPEKYGSTNVQLTGKDGGPIEISVKDKLLAMLEIEDAEIVED